MKARAEGERRVKEVRRGRLGGARGVRFLGRHAVGGDACGRVVTGVPPL